MLGRRQGRAEGAGPQSACALGLFASRLTHVSAKGARAPRVAGWYSVTDCGDVHAASVPRRIYRDMMLDYGQ